MSTDIELLPLPEGVDVIFSPDGNGAALDVFTAEQVQGYARANVAHATAAKDAEIEALRAEVELWRHKAAIHKYRRERLAEALLELCNVIDGHEVPVAVEGKAAYARDALRDHEQVGAK